MAVVAVDQLSKRYAGAAEQAVHSVSFTVNDGEFLVLVGPSGCGKSTVLRMIAGLEPITSGTISIDGLVVNDIPAKARDIAMVFQSYALYPHMTVYDNIAFGLRRRNIAREQIDERVRSAAAKLGLADLLKRKPHALSGGQRQRVALGRAIVRDPKVFLFDEPLSNLDAALRVTTRNELIRQQREIGTTSIFVTHDQVEAMTMGDRICVMNKGRIAQIGRPLEVYRNPADTFVARFIGNPAMNLFDARLETAGSDRVVSLRGKSLKLPERLLPRLATRPDGEIILGIRPEDMFPATAARPAQAALTARVITVEALGAETLLLVALGQPEVEAMIRTGGDAVFNRGDSFEAGFDMDRVHLFDPASTKAIT